MLTATVDVRLLKAKELVRDYYNTYLSEAEATDITMDNVFVVWFCKTLQNWKAIVSTTTNDQRLYEVTHNGDKDETYLDVYKKEQNSVAKGQAAHS